MHYFKVQPRDFGHTLFDTTDLSIIRGSSLTLLHMPALLLEHLRRSFGADMHINVIFGAASELFFSVQPLSAMTFAANLSDVELTGTMQEKRPKKLSKKVWHRALAEIVDRMVKDATDGAVLGAAQALALGEFSDADAAVYAAEQGSKQPDPVDAPDERLTEALFAQLVHGILRARRTRAEMAEVPAEMITRIEATVRAFLTSRPTVLVKGRKAPLHAPLDLFNFSVAQMPAQPKLQLDATMRVLDSMLRLEQMATRSCALPPKPVPLKHHDEFLCAFNGLHAADPKPENWEKKVPTSPSARARREYGRVMKRAFYGKVLENALAMKPDDRTKARLTQALALLDPEAGPIKGFADDFGEVVADTPNEYSLSVQGAIAVLAVDGNDFGKRASAALKAGPERYAAFSHQLDVLKASLMARFLIEMAETPGLLSGQGIAPMETLLWGGDEFTFVFPGWQGWRMLSVLLDEVATWRDDRQQPMTVGCGLVFAPHKAPISSVSAAANDLKELAKHDKSRSLSQVLAYESVDRIHYAPDGFRAAWLGAELLGACYSLTPEVVQAAPKALKALLASVGRSALQRWYIGLKDRLVLPAKEVEEAVKWLDDEMRRIGKGDTGGGGAGTAGPVLCVLPGVTDEAPLLPLAQLALLSDYLVGAPPQVSQAVA